MLVSLDLAMTDKPEAMQDELLAWLDDPITKHVLAGLDQVNGVVTEDLIKGRLNSESWQLYYAQGYIAGLQQLKSAVDDAKQDIIDQRRKAGK